MDTFKTLETGIREIFPDSLDLEITPAMVLGDLPDWDSLTAVNLQSFIQQTLSVSVPGDLLDDEVSIAELIDYIHSAARMQMTG